MPVDQEILFRKHKEYSDTLKTAELAFVHGLNLDPTKAKFLVNAVADVVAAKLELDKANKEAKNA